MLRKNTGQSTLEYITVFAAIVVAFVILAYTRLRPGISDLLNATSERLTNVSGTFRNASL